MRGEAGRRPVIGPLGAPLARSDLPAAGDHRWVPRRKAELVLALKGGLIDMDEAMARYRLTAEELAGWMALFDRHGMAGLRVTRTQAYRGGGEAGGTQDAWRA